MFSRTGIYILWGDAWEGGGYMQRCLGSWTKKGNLYILTEPMTKADKYYKALYKITNY